MPENRTDWKCRQGRGERSDDGSEPLSPKESIRFWGAVLLALSFLGAAVSCVMHGGPQ